MGCLGVHFALTREQERRLLAAEGDEVVLDIIEEIEEDEWDPEYAQESDKAWDAMHRVLSDGTLTPQGGEYPLNRTILGGQQLYEGDDHLICFIPAAEVKDIAAALSGITEEWFGDRYFRIDADDYGFPVNDEDFQYTWNWFQQVRDFYQRAAAIGRSVIFSASQ
jgi:hypothetical protein